MSGNYINPSELEFASREWQQGALNKFVTHLDRKKKNDFFIHAAPGTGKTRAAIGAIKIALDADVVDRVVIVAPTTEIRDQWAENASQFADIDVSSSGSKALSSAEVPHMAITYQAMVGMAPVLASIAAQSRLMVVFDEIHHLEDSDGASWTVAARQAFDDAAQRLILSGTPFRSDGAAIPYVYDVEDIDGDLRYTPRVADYTYSYSEAVNDQVCRPVLFHRYSAEAVIESSKFGSMVVNTGDHDVERKLREEAYRKSINADTSDMPETMIKHALEQLEQIRLIEQPDAAMLIVAREKSDAHNYAAIAEKLGAGSVPVVHSDDMGSKVKIDRFRQSKKRVIASVKMISEGVDIPRIRVIVYLSNIIRSEMFFRQVVGRAVRRQANVGTINDTQWAQMHFVGIPTREGEGDHGLERYAKEIESNVTEAIMNPKSRVKPPRKEAKQAPRFNPRNAQILGPTMHGLQRVQDVNGNQFNLSGFPEYVDRSRIIDGEVNVSPYGQYFITTKDGDRIAEFPRDELSWTYSDPDAEADPLDVDFIEQCNSSATHDGAVFRQHDISPSSFEMASELLGKSPELASTIARDVAAVMIEALSSNKELREKIANTMETKG